MIEINPFKEANKVVSVDWDYALKAVENIDNHADQENRRTIKGKAAINILAEYGVIAYRCASPPENSKLAIVISPPYVYFCPSLDGIDGVFIEEYNQEKHGDFFLELKKEGLFDYTNIGGRLDGWGFFGGMVALSWQGRSLELP